MVSLECSLRRKLSHSAGQFASTMLLRTYTKVTQKIAKTLIVCRINIINGVLKTCYSMERLRKISTIAEVVTRFTQFPKVQKLNTFNYFPFQTGSRFSAKASAPSCWSSEEYSLSMDGSLRWVIICKASRSGRWEVFSSVSLIAA